ncbi:TetR/AcrR family transcriptional regulator [Sphingomonas melonis]|uniref:AcrR family transcriptional regulator n=1 Tax=Sphingomonas melonis TaxID=152682 RepID=A0A7Y9FPQ4_9SPHN|nr:TetR/AcrR family transcriptional regulator [Sphingomonas melonis]NYD91195.1 AcrR family transcriptional regulator [Sphingomonas melonis]
MTQSAYRKPKQARSIRTYEALLDAAGILLGEVGIERISTNLICERAKVTPPTIYRYFDDKYAVIRALAERMTERQQAALHEWVTRHALSDTETIFADIGNLLRTLIHIISEQPGAMWIQRALRAIPSMAPLRLAAHNYAAEILTMMFHRHAPDTERELIRRRVRLAVEITYSIEEMIQEENIAPEQIVDDVHFILKSMLYFPEYSQYSAGPAPDPAQR